MRVRVWISGAEGPSHDFELVEAPRIGERIVVGLGTETEEGIVMDVTWRLQAIEAAAIDLALAAEPVGSVTMVHVICRPARGSTRAAAAAAEIDATREGSATH